MAPKGPKPQKRTSIREDAINLPNLLTFLRIAMIPLVLWLMSFGSPKANFWACIVYILTAVTDFLDGWLARRMGLISLLGKFLDPLADKLLVMAALVWMVYLDRIPMWGVIAVVILVGRELSVTALRTIAMSEGVVMAAGRGGKEKTALQMTAIMLLILYHPYEVNFFFLKVHVDLVEVGLIILYMSVFFAITSAGEYLQLFVEAVEAKEKRLVAEGIKSGGSEDSDE